jgi:hypothetical protein
MELFISTESLWIKDEDSLNYDISIQTWDTTCLWSGHFFNCNFKYKK